MTNLSQKEKALSTAAGYVSNARIDVNSKCGTLGDRVNQMMQGWGGQGASGFTNLMIAWQEKQKTILQALDQLALSLEETEADNVKTDEAQSTQHMNMIGRLEGI